MQEESLNGTRRTLIGAAVAIAFAPAAFAQWRNPPAPGPGFVPNVAAGKTLYVEKCAVCHGVDLRGTDKGPPQIHPVYRPDHHGDVAYQLAVRNGSKQHHWRFGDMAPVPGLRPEDVENITAYIRGEQRKAGLF